MTKFLAFFKVFSHVLWAAIVIFLCIMLKHCGNSSDTLRTAALKKEDSLKALNTTLQASHTADSLEKTALIGEVRELRITAQSSKDSAWMALSKLQKDYNGLSGRIVDNRPKEPDSSGSWVCPQSYVKMCDSCATALQEGSKEVTRLRYKDSATKALYDYEINLRMLYEKDLNRQYDSSQSLFNAQTQVVTALAKAGKQRNSLWLGIEGSYTPLYSSVGGMVSYQLKQGKQFTIGAGLTTMGSIYYSAKAAFKIQLHKLIKTMAKYRKKPIVIEASQWFKNGDHPKDNSTVIYPDANSVTQFEPFLSEGEIVRYYRSPSFDGQSKCKHCNDIMHNHGWIDTLEGGHIVCPGDWIITGVNNENYPCKDDIFQKTYEIAPFEPTGNERKEASY